MFNTSETQNQMWFRRFWKPVVSQNYLPSTCLFIPFEWHVYLWNGTDPSRTLISGLQKSSQPLDDRNTFVPFRYNVVIIHIFAYFAHPSKFILSTSIVTSFSSYLGNPCLIHCTMEVNQITILYFYQRPSIEFAYISSGFQYKNVKYPHSRACI